MRVYFLLAMVAGVGWLGYRQLTSARDHARSLTVLALLLALTAQAEVEWRGADAHYTQVAEALLHHPHPVGVHCERLGAALVSVSQLEGYVPYHEDGSLPTRAQLMRDVCQDLGAWLRSDKRHTSMKQVQALHVFVHETMHLDGIYDEAKAECESMQRTEKAAELFGAAPGEGQRMARAYWQTIYPNMAENYRGGCAPDGVGDDTPGDGIWP